MNERPSRVDRKKTHVNREREKKGVHTKRHRTRIKTAEKRELMALITIDIYLFVKPP